MDAHAFAIAMEEGRYMALCTIKKNHQLSGATADHFLPRGVCKPSASRSVWSFTFPKENLAIVSRCLRTSSSIREDLHVTRYRVDQQA